MIKCKTHKDELTTADADGKCIMCDGDCAERDLFEEYLKEINGICGEDYIGLLNKTPSGGYIVNQTRVTWEYWLAGYKKGIQRALYDN